MAAFDRICSGIPELDSALDFIRLGDNVVWRVSNLQEFHLFLDPFVERTIADGRKLVYVRFASHPALISERPGVKVVSVELSHRFETFTVDIHNLIEAEGPETFYVFDCLSELQTAWATDLMMSNFFRVTCPYLFQLDTVAWFPLIRGMHSFQAIAKIRDTAQLFLDVYPDMSAGAVERGDEKNNLHAGIGEDEDKLPAAMAMQPETVINKGGQPGPAEQTVSLRGVYLRPQKVWNRFSDSMYLPHYYDVREKKFYPVLDGVQASRFYQAMNRLQRPGSEQNMDAWDRFFNETGERAEDGEDVSDACSRMCNIMMSRDEHLRVLIRRYFDVGDYLAVKDHMIGTGMIGGKACGMLLARKIIEKDRPDLFARFEPHDSYYIGSDVFYTFIVENGFWDLRVRQRREAEYFSLAETMAEKYRHGHFPREMDEQFVRLLEYYGQDPIIVRSSSILEDGFGNAFAGKYESVFCANQGSMEVRLEEFKQAIRTVYASTMSLSALDYRKRRGLEKRDEQMAILVQRVSGSHYGPYYMPCAAGVAYSYSLYPLLKDADPAAGMLRLVMGLGTMAVDRVEGSYPRLVSLDMPEVSSASTASDRHRYSQRKIAVVNTTRAELEEIFLEDILSRLPAHVQKALLEHDWDAERMFRERGVNRDILFISCLGLVRRKDLMQDMRDILRVIQDVYGNAVDTEFTINVSPSGEYMINLLQCRPLQFSRDAETVTIPDDLDQESVLLETRGTSMGLSRMFKPDLLVYVDPERYYRLPYADKTKIRDAIHAVNWKLRGQGKHLILMVPGRIGTSSPELGVPTAFSDISEFDLICEIAYSSAGYNPELSFGSHFFQDLVESGIGYTAVFESGSTVKFDPERVGTLKDIKGDFLGDRAERDPAFDAVRVCDLRDTDAVLYMDRATDRTVLYMGQGDEPDGAVHGQGDELDGAGCTDSGTVLTVS